MPKASARALASPPPSPVAPTPVAPPSIAPREGHPALTPFLGLVCSCEDQALVAIAARDVLAPSLSQVLRHAPEAHQAKLGAFRAEHEAIGHAVGGLVTGYAPLKKEISS